MNPNNDDGWNQEEQDDGDWGEGDGTNNTKRNSDRNKSRDEDWAEEENNEWGDNNGDEEWEPNQPAKTNKGPASKLPKTSERTLSPKKSRTKIVYADPAMPQPPPDLTLASTDIRIIKYCGVTGVVLAILIFICQVI